MKIILTIIFLLPLLFLAYNIIVYFRTRVPIVLTPKKYFPVIFDNINIRPETVIYDLGCARGDFLFAAEKYHPGQLVGFELSPLHAIYGKIKAKLLKSKIKIYLRDFFRADISQADIIYLFLVESAVIKVWQKIKNEAKKGALVVVLSDHIPDLDCSKTIKLKPGQTSGPALNIYQLL